MDNALTGTQALPEGETAANPGNETAPELSNAELDTNAGQGEGTEGGEGGQGGEAGTEEQQTTGEVQGDNQKKLKFNDLPKWAIKRINDETNRRKDVERQLEEARRGNSVVQEPAAGSGEGNRSAAPASTDDEVERRAAQLVDHRAYQNRVNAWAEAGNRDFKEDFNERCNLIAGLGAGPEFMTIVTDPEIVKDGHRVVAEMADDPEEAQRILRLPPVKMAIELARIGEKLSKPTTPTPKPISRVPAPVTPVGGNSNKTSALEDPDADQGAWSKEFDAMMAAKLKRH